MSNPTYIADCASCATCQTLQVQLNKKIAAIGSRALYNRRYEIGRYVDYPEYRMLMFYKQILEDICNGEDCECYGSNTDAILEKLKTLLS